MLNYARQLAGHLLQVQWAEDVVAVQNALGLMPGILHRDTFWHTNDLAAAIGSVYGADAEQAYLPHWRKHIGFEVDLTLDVVADLVKTHVPTLKEVSDVQNSGNTEQAYVALRQAFDHMAMAANPLDGAIVNQFPAKYAR